MQKGAKTISTLASGFSYPIKCKRGRNHFDFGIGIITPTSKQKGRNRIRLWNRELRPHLNAKRSKTISTLESGFSFPFQCNKGEKHFDFGIRIITPTPKQNGRNLIRLWNRDCRSQFIAKTSKTISTLESGFELPFVCKNAENHFDLGISILTPICLRNGRKNISTLESAFVPNSKHRKLAKDLGTV